MDSNVKLVQSILKYTFGLVPIVAGLDKFTNILRVLIPKIENRQIEDKPIF